MPKNKIKTNFVAMVELEIILTIIIIRLSTHTGA